MPNAWGHHLSKPHFIIIGQAAATQLDTNRVNFVNEGAYGAHEETQGRTVNTLGGADHRRMRRLFRKAIFGRRAMSDWTRAVTPIDFDQCWHFYRRHGMSGLMMWTVTLAHIPLMPDMQPEAISIEMLRRTSAAMSDLGTLSLEG